MNKLCMIKILIANLLFLLSIVMLNAQSILDNNPYIIDLGGEVRIAENFNNFTNVPSQFNYIHTELLLLNNMSYDFTAKLLVEATYNSLDTSLNKYEQLGEFYIGFEHNSFGNLFFGRTPSIYYNGYSAGWLDNGYIYNKTILDAEYLGAVLGTRNPDNTLYYSHIFKNLKIATQISGKSNKLKFNSTLDIERVFGAGANAVIAFGPLNVGIGYLFSSLKQSNNTASEQVLNNYKSQIFNTGAKFDFSGIYTALSLDWGVSRWDINNDSFGVNYIIMYDYGDNHLGFIPQIGYGYLRHSGKSAYLSNNQISIGMSYYFSNNFNLFLDSNWDIRTTHQRNVTNHNTKDLLSVKKKNIFLIGLGYSFY